MRGLMVCALALMAGGAEAAVYQFTYAGNPLVNVADPSDVLPGINFTISVDADLAADAPVAFTIGYAFPDYPYTLTGNYGIADADAVLSGYLSLNASLEVVDSFVNFEFYLPGTGTVVESYNTDRIGDDLVFLPTGSYRAPQTFFTLNVIPDVPEVPLPASGLALLMGLAALGAYRRVR